ncbi:MAG TPA: MraY family glycosyltransferase [Candidatus Magasanikbacteria bacterium]|nr:MraY family glycosyltransferase [Candidatus Magasanikbacteria bacterium]
MVLHSFYFIAAFIISVVITGIVAVIMRRFGIIDQPREKNSRKIHTRAVALGGGFALYLTFFLLVFIGWFFQREASALFDSRSIIGLFIGSTILMIGGIIDDKYTIRPRYQIIAPIVACIMIIIFGVGPDVISNPWGGVIDLSVIQWSFPPLIHIVLFADILVFVWLFGMMFTTKFLDGLDGLVAGVVAIAAIVMYLVSVQPQWYDPTVAFLSIIFAGTCLGFLVWNFNPAKIFLGEGGSLMTGFILGCLAIISKSKIAVTVMVVGIPMIDVIRVIVARMRKGKSVYIGDREHLHYRLLESGLSHRQSVLLLYAISSLFGMIALFLQAEHQMIALSFLFVLMLLLGLWFSKREEKSQS